MSDTIRVFTAVDVPASIYTWARPLLETVSSYGCRIIPPEKMHLTLQFHGDCTQEDITQIQAHIESLDVHPFTVSVQGCGAFPKPQFPRVIWLGAEHPSLHMLAMQFSQKRSFTPHITVARQKQPSSSMETVLQQYQDAEWGQFPIETLTLYKSILKPGGAEHVPLYTKSV